MSSQSPGPHNDRRVSSVLTLTQSWETEIAFIWLQYKNCKVSLCLQMLRLRLGAHTALNICSSHYAHGRSSQRLEAQPVCLLDAACRHFSHWWRVFGDQGLKRVELQLVSRLSSGMRVGLLRWCRNRRGMLNVNSLPCMCECVGVCVWARSSGVCVCAWDEGNERSLEINMTEKLATCGMSFSGLGSPNGPVHHD